MLSSNSSSVSESSSATLLRLIYIGVCNARLPDGGIILYQLAYIDKLKPIALDKNHSTNVSSPLQAQEHYDCRSLVCSMLWLCLTRLDVIADIVTLQQEMVSPPIANAKEANNALHRAKKNKVLNGMHFRKLMSPLKLQGIGDAHQADNRSLYAQEGKLVVFMSDALRVDDLGE